MFSQTRLTSTRAVSGLCRSTIARASSNRPLPLRNGWRFAVAQHAQESPRHFLAQLVRIAAHEDARLDRRRQVFEHHRPRRRRGAAGAPFLDRLEQLVANRPAPADPATAPARSIPLARHSAGAIGAVQHLPQRFQIRVGQAPSASSLDGRFGSFELALATACPHRPSSSP